MEIKINFYDKHGVLTYETMNIPKCGKNRRDKIARKIGTKKYGEKFHSAEIVKEK